MTYKPTLGFVGAGKVGRTLARLWYAQGYTIRAVYSRSRESAEAFAAQVATEVMQTPLQVVSAADLTFLTVPDDVIATVASEIARGWQGMDVGEVKGIVHTSGARDISTLASLAEYGFNIGSLHPVFPFADVDTAIASLPGAAFGLETESEILRNWLQGLVETIRGNILTIPAGGKAIYHSAFVFASNYVVTLYSIAERLLTGIGADREAADRAIYTLLAGTVENISRQGIPRALTGTLVRGDVQTVTAHLRELEQFDASLAQLYLQLARLSLPMVAARNIDTTFIEALLSRENHAPDNP